MKKIKRISLITLGTILGGATAIHIASKEKTEITTQYSTKKEDKESDTNIESTKYTYDSTKERMEHSEYKNNLRPITEAFVEIYKGISPQETEALLSKAGKVVYSDIMYDLPSVYEKFEMSVINEVNEKVVVTFKDGMVIKKEYINDYTNTSNINKAFVEYHSDLFETEYSSGIISNDSSLISKNKKVWELEEDFLSIYN